MDCVLCLSRPPGPEKTKSVLSEGKHRAPPAQSAPPPVELHSSAHVSPLGRNKLTPPVFAFPQYVESNLHRGCQAHSSSLSVCSTTGVTTRSKVNVSLLFVAPRPDRTPLSIDAPEIFAEKSIPYWSFKLLESTAGIKCVDFDVR